MNRGIDPGTLLGIWAYDRSIDDRRHGLPGRVTGEMSFTREGERIRWAESGILDWRGQRTPATRTLFLEDGPDGWFVTFEDGRYFHPWSTDDPVEHLCGADRYEALIARSAGEAWMITWTVVGPAKDYTMTTSVTRPDSYRT